MGNNEQTAQAIRDHHATLVADLQARVDLLADDVAAGRDHHNSAQAIVAILEEQILPHAAAEEQFVYPLASRRDTFRTLTESMIVEHRYLQDAIATFGSTAEGVPAAAAAQAISTVFRLHAGKENDFILPALAADPAIDLAEVLAGMHDLLEAAPPSGAKSPPSGPVEDGVVDVRGLPPARRHQLIFSTLDSLDPGQSFELVNDHDPKPLRYQLAAEQSDQFTWDNLEAGPTAWRVRITRTAA